ncbi:BLUF domain-containing protein [Marinobacter caseinilyticus]|uniref:BLUF domain-containing protein n=1 Tax=Marinobacter caseinilyticus TaxID=2692195 RepID=UPI00140CFFE1|nr:BLUF domain-containing protein [Marinobacter caseinilyticus]
MSLIRLAYASKATFDAMPLERGIEPNVARILLTSRRNNPKKGLVGGLYYGNGCFFQYLEGEAEAVHAVYETIKRDSRHKEVKTLIEEPLEARTFTNWSMKYVPVAGDVSQFLKRHKLTAFDPYQFDRALCDGMIELIRQSSHDDRLVNHSGTHSGREADKVVSTGARNGLIVAGVIILAAVVVGGIAMF